MRAALLVIAACTRPPAAGAPCDTVGIHLYQISRDALATTPVDEATRRALTAELPRIRDAIVHSCVDTDFPPSVRTCMATAADHPAFVACETALTEAQRRAIARAAGEIYPR